MTTAELAHPAPVAVHPREKLRTVVLKVFLTVAIFNNLYIAVACFAQGGGRLLAGAPALAASVIGAMAILTILGAGLALLWRKLGVYAVLAAGGGATAAALAATLWAQAGLFLVGTAFMGLLAHHLWHRFR